MTAEENKRQLELLSRESWFFFSLPRQSAQRYIRRNGEFLVRVSSNTEDFVLSTKWNGRFLHLVVIRTVHLNKEGSSSFSYSFENIKRETVVDLILYHWKNQFPMNQSSEAVIYRPINRNMKNSFHVLCSGFRNPSITTNSSCNSLDSNDSEDPGVDNDFCGLNISQKFLTSTFKGKLKGCSLHDLRFNTYLNPSDVTNNFSISMVDGLNQYTSDLSNVYTHVYQTKPKDVKEIITPKLSISETRNVTKSGNNAGKINTHINRKDIRYVQMALPSDIEHPTLNTNDRQNSQLCHAKSTNALNTITNSEAGHRWASLSTLSTRQFERLTNSGFINYDLTRVFVSVLAANVGCGLKPLDKNLWSHFNNIIISRHYLAADFAEHMTMELGHILLDWPQQVFESSISSKSKSGHGFKLIVHSYSTQYKLDIAMRYRILTRFVMTSMIMCSNILDRCKILGFWLETAHCLSDICRDHYSLGALLEALFSSEILSLKKTWSELSNLFPRLTGTLHWNYLLKIQQKFQEILQINANQPKNIFCDLDILKCFDVNYQIPNLKKLLDFLSFDKNLSHGERISNTSTPTTNENNSKSIGDENVIQNENQMNSNKLDLVNQINTYYDSINSDSLWITEIGNSTFKKNEFLTLLFKTETLMAFLIGPVKFEESSMINILLEKIDRILTKISNILET